MWLVFGDLRFACSAVDQKTNQVGGHLGCHLALNRGCFVPGGCAAGAAGKVPAWSWPWFLHAQCLLSWQETHFSYTTAFIYFLRGSAKKGGGVLQSRLPSACGLTCLHELFEYWNFQRARRRAKPHSTVKQTHSTPRITWTWPHACSLSLKRLSVKTRIGISSK